MNESIMKISIFVGTSFLILGLLSNSGCSNNQRIPCLWNGTKEYESRVESFVIKENEAREIAYKNRKNEYSLVLEKANFVLDDEYVFGHLCVNGDASVAGYYVNGHTGEVRYVWSTIWVKGKSTRTYDAKKE